jgi:septum site-determining protein MinC
MKRHQSSPPSRPVRRPSGARRFGPVTRAEVAALVTELLEQGLQAAGRAGEAPRGPEVEAAAAADGPRCLFIDRPVRSGQSIRFPEGDVTVIGSVSSGAEIMAGGSIHVYGALRGRAFAGLGGNSAARILCSSLDPELLVINGLYATADEISPSLRNKPAQVRVDGQAMSVTALD